MPRWHLLTGEYPPRPGGVSDYTSLVARALADAGDEVHVWHPPTAGAAPRVPGVEAHALPDHFGAGARRALSAAWRRPDPERRVVVQWVPHAFGQRSLNVAFCAWLLARRARAHERVGLMVHEPFVQFGEGGWRQDVAAAIHRGMATMLLAAAEQVWVSIPEWAERLRPWTLGRAVPMTWQPVPSNVPRVDAPADVAAIRARLGGGPVVAHFGTYGPLIAGPLAPILERVLVEQPDATLLLLGARGETLRDALASRVPAAAHRIHATGALDAPALSAHLQACDVMVQPYPDGVSTRRGSAMAVAEHGLACVATRGRTTDATWEGGAVTLVDGHDPARWADAVAALLRDPERRRAQGAALRRLYEARFDLRHTIDAMRRPWPHDALGAARPSPGTVSPLTHASP